MTHKEMSPKGPKTLRLILSNHLTETLPILQACDKQNDTILMCETRDEATFVKHHKKKIAFLWSAMRHFAQDLKQKGYPIHYVPYNDSKNSGTYQGEVGRLVKAHGIERVLVTCPGDYELKNAFQSWEKSLGLQVSLLPDTRFLCSQESFRAWAKGRKTLRMEYFYREMRKKYNLLMDQEEPEGGQWNYDAQNRKKPPQGTSYPAPYAQEPDAITREVMDLVDQAFPTHFGDLTPFYFAVTRRDALEALELFITQRLPFFGDYQDAMVEGEPWMYHSHLSFYLNCGLLLPEECLRRAEEAYRDEKAPLNAVEGFIRQILGWREYVWGIYWLKMPDYKKQNYFQATRRLPDFYWSGQTKMNCLRQCVEETKQNAYAHHIQRLMVLGNFALLAGIQPSEVNEWFLIVYADAFEWVELPNVSGMILYADGGYLASKPYASGGGYIKKMSTYCQNCSYNVEEKTGPQACPFNYLYWDFLDRNRSKLSGNPRLGMMYKLYDRLDDEKKKRIQEDSQTFLKDLETSS